MAGYNFFWYNATSLTSALLIQELQNSFLSNINDNDEKKNKKKSLSGIFKRMGGNIPDGNFTGWCYPDTIFKAWIKPFKARYFSKDQLKIHFEVYNRPRN